MKKIFIIFILILPLFLSAQSSVGPVDNEGFPILPNSTFGQIDPNTGLPLGIEEQVSVTILPSVPAPRERVTIQVESFSTNLNKANFTWYVNGEVVESSSGIGKTTFSFNAPNSGEKMIVKYSLKKENGGILTKEFPFVPAGVDILWEAQTYTPPFYKGKSLFTRQSSLVFVAIPDLINPNTGNKIPDNELVYKWKKGGSVLQSESGYGRSSLRLTSDIISRPFEMEVEVSAVGIEGLKAKRRLTVVPFEPEVLLYENNPLYGIMFEKALVGDFLIEREEMEISAVPYHFSAEERNNPNLEYKWLLNDQKIDTFSNRDSLTFRKVDDSTGRANVSISTNHLQNILQASDTRFSIILNDLINPASSQNNDTSIEDFAF